MTQREESEFADIMRLYYRAIVKSGLPGSPICEARVTTREGDIIRVHEFTIDSVLDGGFMQGRGGVGRVETRATPWSPAIFYETRVGGRKIHFWGKKSSSFGATAKFDESIAEDRDLELRDLRALKTRIIRKFPMEEPAVKGIYRDTRAVIRPEGPPYKVVGVDLHGYTFKPKGLSDEQIEGVVSDLSKYLFREK